MTLSLQARNHRGAPRPRGPLAPLALAFVACWVALGSSQPAQVPVALVAGTVVDGTGSPPFVGTVVFQGDRIVSVGPGTEVPAGATAVDSRGKTVLPGLFDIHTHVLESPAWAGSSDWLKNLLAYTYCGITSVVELGSYAPNFEAERDLRVAGENPIPRLVVASRLAPPLGHGAESGRPSIHTNEVLTPRQADHTVASILSGTRPDLIKVFADGWRYGTGPDMDNFRPDTLRAIVEKAHAAGLPVISHTVTAGQARAAAVAGVDIIGHSAGDRELDADVVEMIRAKGLTYVPTLSVYEPRGDEIPPLLAEVLEPSAREAIARRKGAAPAADAAAEAGRRRRFEVMRRNVALARAGGARMAAGTDAGMPNTFHGWASLHELELLVGAGLTPLEALTAATGNAARATHLDGQRGTLAPGRLADILVVEGRPAERIQDIGRIAAVYSGGRLVDRGRLRAAIAAAGPYPLAPRAVPPLLDDFEAESGRAPGGQAWVDITDAGHDRSRLSWVRTPRPTGGHGLLAFVRLGVKDNPNARLTLPLAGGGLLPADASAYKGIQFDVRGDGAYKLVVGVRGRAGAPPAAGFTADARWRHVVIPFASLGEPGEAPSWARALTTVAFEMSGPAGSQRWLEIDNVGFVR